jgi:hypothetical protein
VSRSALTLFTDNMRAGTSVVPDGEALDLAPHEVAVRHMALITRFLRKIYGRFLLEALAEGQKTDKFMRFFQPGPGHPTTEVGFFVVTVKIPDLELEGGYEQYRSVRGRILRTYALTLLQKIRNLKVS